MSDEERKESYLTVRGWVRVQRPIPYCEHWQLAWQADDVVKRVCGTDALPLDMAVKRQLKWDAHGLLYLLDVVNETKPETRRLLGGELLLLVFAAVKEFVKDKDKMIEGARIVGQAMREAELDPEHKANMAALTRAYEAGRRAGEPETQDPKEKAN